MKLSFACESCGTKFSNVAAEMAGRPCRCNKCGHRFRVPGSPAAAPQLVGAGVATSSAASAPKPSLPQPPAGKTPPAAPMVSQRVLQTIQSQIALAPVSTDRLRVLAAKKHDDDFTVSDRTPYQLAEPVPTSNTKKKKFRPAKAVKQTYSNELRKLQKWFRYFNELGLELTVPFFVLIPFGYILQKGNWSSFGAIMVLVINLLRLGFGLANILVIPFRESPLQGLLFFVPPWPYLRKHWNKFSKPFGRVVSPVSFILGVVFLYAFMPAWVGHKPDTKVVPRDPNGKPIQKEDESGFKAPTVQGIGKKLQKGAATLKQDFTGKMKDAQDFSGDKLKDLGDKAVKGINDATQQIQEKIDSKAVESPPPAK